MKKQKILLIDANALIHRAFHALPPLTNKRGEIVNAVYGFLTILFKAINDIKPEYIAIAFDFPKPTFRHKKFKEYKATREKAPQELISQFDKVKEAINAFSFPYFEKEGFEADDLVGTLTTKAKEHEIEAIIVTGDADEIQLVNENTKVYTMRRGFTDTILYNIAQVKEKYEGLRPEQLIDFKALKGDSSDNIPGLKGIGDKTAIHLIKNYGNLENLYFELEKNSEKTKALIKPAVLKTLKNSKEIAFKNKELVTILKNVPIDFNINNSFLSDYNKQEALKFLNNYGFKSLINKMPVCNREMKKELDWQYKIIRNKKELTNLIKEISKAGYCAIDTETENLDSINAQLVGLSFSCSENLGFYLPFDKSNKETLSILKKFFEDKKVKKIGHNLKYDINVLKSYNINLENIYFDTMLAYYLIHPGDRRYNLNDLAFIELGYQKIKIESLIGKKGKNQQKMSEVDIEKIAQYSSEDAVITFRLFKKIKKQLIKSKLEKLFKEIEMPIIPVLTKMEKNGVKIDEKFLKILSEKLKVRIKQLENKICKISNCNFNLNSPIQLKEILFNKLKIADGLEIKKKLRKLKTGGYSTDAKSLEKLKTYHPIIKLIIEHRELSKLKNTYTDSLPKLINKKTERIHTSFNQTITATGRLSSSDPNLQNIPTRTEIGREIRKAFVAAKGYQLISADYSQIELRIIAHLSGDKKMIDSFIKGEDIHQKTAAEVNEVSSKNVSYEMRQAAKATNFGIVYGIGPHGLSEQLGWSRDEAKRYIEKYHQKHPQLIKFLEKIIIDTRKKGFTKTLLGRIRPIPEINSPNFQVRNSGERMAINFPAQGTAADLIKKAMIEIDKKISKISPKSKIIIQVHDELLFEVPKNDVNKIIPFIKKEMESVYPDLAVPIKVDISLGNNWQELKKINI